MTDASKSLVLYLLRKPYGWFVAVGGMVYAFSQLPEQEFNQVIRLLSAMNHPVGWGILLLFACTLVYHWVLKPVALYLKSFLKSYLDKEAKYIDVMGGIKDNLADLKGLLENDLVEIMREIRCGLEKNYTEIMKVSSDLSAIIVKRAVFKHKTDHFHASQAHRG